MLSGRGSGLDGWGRPVRRSRRRLRGVGGWNRARLEGGVRCRSEVGGSVRGLGLGLVPANPETPGEPAEKRWLLGSRIWRRRGRRPSGARPRTGIRSRGRGRRGGHTRIGTNGRWRRHRGRKRRGGVLRWPRGGVRRWRRGGVQRWRSRGWSGWRGYRGGRGIRLSAGSSRPARRLRLGGSRGAAGVDWTRPATSCRVDGGGFARSTAGVGGPAGAGSPPAALGTRRGCRGGGGRSGRSVPRSDRRLALRLGLRLGLRFAGRSAGGRSVLGGRSRGARGLAGPWAGCAAGGTGCATGHRLGAGGAGRNRRCWAVAPTSPPPRRGVGALRSNLAGGRGRRGIATSAGRRGRTRLRRSGLRHRGGSPGRRRGRTGDTITMRWFGFTRRWRLDPSGGRRLDPGRGWRLGRSSRRPGRGTALLLAYAPLTSRGRPS
jgi:hypothetical protein